MGPGKPVMKTPSTTNGRNIVAMTHGHRAPMGRVPVRTITSIEEGRSVPSQITGNKLAKALEVRPDQVDAAMAAVHGAWESKDGCLGPRWPGPLF